MKRNKLKNIKITLTLSLIFIVNITFLYSAFWELKPGARSGGMGFAYSAIVKNSESVFYNPANLIYTEKPNLFLEYSKLYYGLDFDSLGYKSIFYSIPESEIGSFGAGFTSFDGNFYSESTYFLSYSKSFSLAKARYSAGVTFKYLKKNIDKNYSNDISNDPFFDEFGTALSNFTFDLGFTYRSSSEFINSFVVKNITKPNMAYQSNIDESLPMIVTYGLAKKYNIIFPTVFSAELEIMDTSIGKDMNQIWYGFGVESELKKDNLFGRLGFNKNEISAGLSYSNLSYGKSNFSFDYSISVPFSLTDESLPVSLSTHRFGINIFYGTFLPKPDIDDDRWSNKIPKSFKLKELSSDDNEKEVVLWVKDRAGNISNTISKVVIDTKKPTLDNETEIKIIDEESFYLLIYSESANYYRYKIGSDWSEWKILATDETYYENLIKGYISNQINYMSYQIKDKAGNIFEEKFVIYNGEKSSNYDKYPVIDDIILKNSNSMYLSNKFNSTKINIEVITKNNSFDELEIIYDEKSLKSKIIKSSESNSSNKKSFLLDISNDFPSDGPYTIRFQIKKSNFTSNPILKTIYIDNTKPKCYFKIHGKKNNKGFFGSKIIPSLTSYQSFDTRQWLLTADTLSFDIDKWSKIKPTSFNFENTNEYSDDNRNVDTNIKRYQLFLKVIDEAGNESIWYNNFYNFDERAPQIEELSLNAKITNNRYVISSNKIEPFVKLKSTDYLEFIFDDNSTKKYDVINDSVNFNSSLTIPTELKVGKIIIRAYNNDNIYDERQISYVININKPIVSEFKVFDKVTGSNNITNDQNIGLYIHGINIDQIEISDNINFENSSYKSYNSPLFEYRILDKEGLQYLFVRVKNKKQISSDTYSAVIKLNRELPTLDYSITTLADNIVNLSTIEIIYDKNSISNDITGYYFTEIIDDIPSIHSNKWSKEKLNFYTFKSDKDEVKELFLFLKDDANNISLPIKKIVILEKFDNNISDENFEDNKKQKRLTNKNKNVFQLIDFETRSNKVTDNDSIRVEIGNFGKKYSSWILSEIDLSDNIDSKSDKWLSKKPYKYQFTSITPDNIIANKTLYLFMRDNDGVINRKEIKSSIKVDKFKTLLGNVEPRSGSLVSINDTKIEFIFNKQLHKTKGVNEITTFCSGLESGFHNSKLSIKNKKIVVNLQGQFSQNEDIYLWIFGYFYDINMKKNFFSKKLNYKIEGEILKKKLIVSGIINELSGFSNEYLVKGKIENLNTNSNDTDSITSNDDFISYIFAPVSKFTSTNRKRFNNSEKTMIYEFSELVDGEEILFKAQYFTNSGEKSEIYESKIIIDIKKPESRLYLFSENGSNVGFSNDHNLKVEIKADADTKEFLLEEIDE